MPRDTRLTLWPEQMAYYPLVNSWADIKRKDSLDFTECFGVHSCGMTASLLNLHKLFRFDDTEPVRQTQHTQLSFFPEKKNPLEESTTISTIQKIFPHSDSKLMQDCIDLNFFTYISDYLCEEHKKETYKTIHKDPIERNYFSIDTIIYPIFKFNFTKQKTDRQKAIPEFFDYFVPIFRKLSEQYVLQWEQFLSILYEIAKNSAEHTEDDAYIGLDLLIKNEAITICVLIGDLGPGIYNNIRDYFLLRQKPGRKGYAGFAEAYRTALEYGFSTKNDAENIKGRGMSFIIENSCALRSHISVFDVKTRLILSSLNPSKAPPHNEITRVSRRIDGKKPFFYYLQYEVPKK